MKKWSVVSCQLEVGIQRVKFWLGRGGVLFVSLFIDSLSPHLSPLSLPPSLSRVTVRCLNIEQYFWIIMWQFSSNKWLLIVDREFFLSFSCQHPGNLVPRPPEEVPNGLCHSQSVDLSNITWALRRLINKVPGNAFGAIIRIRPIIIITFGTTNVVVYNGVTFGAGIGTVKAILLPWYW